MIEQSCLYQDLDDLDQSAFHLCGTDDHDGKLRAYLRVLPPGTRFAQPSIGRILTCKAARGRGFGHQAMRQALQFLNHTYPASSILMSAQQHLQPFYQQFGFVSSGGDYEEDGIPHIEMVLNRG